MTAPVGEINTRSYVQLFNRSTLSIEIIVVFIAGLTANALRLAPSAQVWVTTIVVAVMCVIALALARFPIGLGFAAVVQVILVLAGFIIPTMWFLGGVFLVIWIVGVVVGNRIDREKRAYMHAHPEEYPEVQGGSNR